MIRLATSVIASTISVATLFAAIGVARGETPTPISEADMTFFYKNPSPARVARLVAYFNAPAQSDKPSLGPPTIGFLAAAFQRYPGDIDTMIPAGLSPRTLGTVAMALRLAGQDAKAHAIADRLRASGSVAPDLSSVPTSLDAVAASGPSEFDMFWGASFATADPRFCSKILARFAAVANVDDNAQDLIAIVKDLQTHADLHWVVDKRGAVAARELSYASTALWALHSNAEQHEFVRIAVQGYISAHPTEPASKALVTLAQEYGHYDIHKLVSVAETVPGKHSATINVAYLSQILDDLGRHATTYPPHFASPDDRRRAEHDVTAISTLLDPLVGSFSNNPTLLLRLALLHGIGHNLDIPGSADKAIGAFTTLLNLKPDDPQANYQYGAFLAARTIKGEGIPFLEKAKGLGVVDADYWLGMSYQVIGERTKAVENLESYTKRVPTDQNAARILDTVRKGKMEISK
jgi:hypothetical protein